jgi:hypothetical protein
LQQYVSVDGGTTNCVFRNWIWWYCSWTRILRTGHYEWHTVLYQHCGWSNNTNRGVGHHSGWLPYLQTLGIIKKVVKTVKATKTVKSVKEVKGIKTIKGSKTLKGTKKRAKTCKGTRTGKGNKLGKVRALQFVFAMIGDIDFDFSMISNVDFDFDVIGPSTSTLA